MKLKLNDFLVFFLYAIVGDANCYFPIEFQGTFLMQTQATSKDGTLDILYSEITIESDAIPPWGRCHRRRGNNVILSDSTGREDCMRCFHITLKSPNIIQIHTEGLRKCYTNEEAAKATCPSERDVKERKFKEIMLFRKHNPLSINPTIESTFCPINGQYRFTYTANNGTYHCDQGLSNLSNCPKGDVLNLKFRQCSTFSNMDIEFLCLGDWENHNGERYLALMDLREDIKSRPKYRCGLYREDSATKKVHISLSCDSTCITHLKSSADGFESFTLTPISTSTFEKAKCYFPEWTQGKWEKVKIDEGIFKFRDSKHHFRTLTSKCIHRQNNGPNDRFIVHSLSQCGEHYYTCVWMKRRSTNILEFQFSSKKSQVFINNLCDDSLFTSDEWVTQGRKNIAMHTPCPIMGDYTGVVPGDHGLCAKVASDCNNPDIMFYTVSSCENRSHIYEEREYRCLGNWEEDETLYTYTQRIDMPGFQCFSGKILENGDGAYIKEAGDSCIRGEDPFIYGMKIHKQAPCPRPHITSYISMGLNRPYRPPKIMVHKSTSNVDISIVSQPASQPTFPFTRSSVTKDPHWYQADLPSTKLWRPPTMRPFIHPHLRRNNGHTSIPLLYLIILITIFANILL